MRRLEAWLLGTLLAVFAVGVALVPLQTPWFTRFLAGRVSELPAGTAVSLAESARSFVVTGNTVARTALEQALTSEAVSHLEDVRVVLAGANRAVILLGLVLIIWWFARGRRDPQQTGAAFGHAALLLALGAGLALAVALTDFDTFFSAFHGLFFAEGTWTFPSDSVLIQLFPQPFWTWAGVAWAALVLAIAVAYAFASKALGARAGADTRG